MLDFNLILRRTGDDVWGPGHNSGVLAEESGASGVENRRSSISCHRDISGKLRLANRSSRDVVLHTRPTVPEPLAKGQERRSASARTDRHSEFEEDFSPNPGNATVWNLIVHRDSALAAWCCLGFARRFRVPWLAYPCGAAGNDESQAADLQAALLPNSVNMPARLPDVWVPHPSRMLTCWLHPPPWNVSLFPRLWMLGFLGLSRGVSSGSRPWKNRETGRTPYLHPALRSASHPRSSHTFLAFSSSPVCAPVTRTGRTDYESDNVWATSW
ncbi:hypothetical protein K456DRAFT_1910610 [Colletotrichum gloeosporioides 23]|nr:hypothetical protein K456DRAFT_1910610 [Colletotrichum gloeosporioides 23]